MSDGRAAWARTRSVLPRAAIALALLAATWERAARADDATRASDQQGRPRVEGPAPDPKDPKNAAADKPRGDPLNSRNHITKPEEGPKDKQKADDGKATGDFNILPVAGGDTDIGIGVGFFAGYARKRKGMEPYIWNLEAAGFITGKPRDGGGVLLPYQDLVGRLTIPRFLGKPMRLEIQPEYSFETITYYGLGNASTTNVPAGQKAPQYFEFVRVHPTISATVHVRIIDHLAAITGFGFTQNVVQIRNGTKIDDDQKNGNAEVKRLLGNSRADHPVIYFKYGVQWDTRDNEVSPTKGTYDEIVLKLAPGYANGEFPHRYGQTTAIARVYYPLIKNRLTFAARAVGDGFFGDSVPFYELTRYADTYATGVNGIRGVPAQRYSGRGKVFTNTELRVDIATFKLFNKTMAAGAVAFFDAGRFWADTKRESVLDGTGLGLKYGVGTGARLKSGDTFVLRLDVAWSPDATPIGAYLATGEIF